MMVTASDIKQLVVEAAKCDGLDDWIREVLQPMFLHSFGKAVHLDQRKARWARTHFEAAMTTRGFKVVFHCEDRPCATPYYVVSL